MHPRKRRQVLLLSLLKGCNERFKAHEANDLFVKNWKGYHSAKAVLKCSGKIVTDYSKKTGKDQSVSKQQIDVEIEKNQQRIQNAQQLMLDGQLEPSDYRDIKSRFEKTVMELEKRNGKYHPWF